MSKLLSDNDKLSESSLEKPIAYSNYWEYYADCLKKLDRIIQFRMQRTHVLPTDNPLDQLRGLLITEDEVLALLNENVDRVELQTQWDNEFQQVIELDARIQARLKLSDHIRIPIMQAAVAFDLTQQEVECVFICLSVELDRKYEKIFGYLQDDITSKYPTVDLIQHLLCRTSEDKLQIQQTLAANSKLSKFFFKKEDGTNHNGSFLAKALRLDDRIISYLINPNRQFESSSPYYQIFDPHEFMDELLIGQEIQHQLIDFTAVNFDNDQQLHNRLLFNLWGNPGMGKKLQVKHFCKHLNKTLILVNLRAIREKTQEYASALAHIFREATLYNAVIAFLSYDILLEEDEATQRVLFKINHEMNNFKGILFLLSNKPWKPTDHNRHQVFISVELQVPEDEERKYLWSSFSRPYTFDDSIDWGAMASKFKFSPGQIKQSIIAADHYAKWRQPEAAAKITTEDLHKASYAQVQHKLENKATHIKPKRLWDEVILPPEQKELLRNACNQVKYRHVVYGEWGFEKKLSYGKGVSILFAGPPGTGKTMSAEVVAKELMLEIYKVDLSQVISKYIGETEKNLHEIFHEAQFSNAILFFDEADALFGKRSEVKDSHDKYANIETAYLLQKIEEYAGITILATNFSQNIDEAFMRRLNYVIKFPFPDAEYREKIWRSMFPVEAPRSVDIDYTFIAQKFEIAGGNIKNIVVSAAFLAAESNQEIGMKHIIQAARHELKKSGKLLLKEDLGEYDMM